MWFLCGTFVSGGNRLRTNVEISYSLGSRLVLPPLLLKPLSRCGCLQPVRDHFENNAEAKALLKQVKSFKVTK